VARKPLPEGTAPGNHLQHIAELARAHAPTLHPGGVPFVVAPLAVALVGRKHKWVRRSALTLAAANATFFRHPKRVPPSRPNVVVAAADGEVTLVDSAPPPPELGLGRNPVPRVSIFLSVFDVHVQRSPVTGIVTQVVHQPGQFLSADLAEASDANERNSSVMRAENGKEVVVVQIAGLIARRIVCDARVGDTLAVGETYGLIRFGSRVDTFFPEGTKLLVERGQRTVGAETILADLS
jgi:phosphatidylserine decarboxylase